MVIDEVANPIGDNPKNKPDTPAILKLNATDKTDISTNSNFPSLNKTLTRQYPGITATKINPKKYVSPENKELEGIK
ncbi:MAG TPA: hypothetical protein VMX17_12045 [Candidatus Glassbacteria bacterium]|nr:hypothetical protein [Candidatus Glassbacteria bacterium]